VHAITHSEANIPLTGPVIILANHPGAYDSMAIGSAIPRTDLNIIVGKTRLYQVMPHVHPHMHYASQDRADSMTALRQATRHLEKGGTLLQFGAGKIEPDPALYPLVDAVFEHWSPSIEIFMRKVPGVQVVPTIASNVLLRRFAHHPLTHLRRDAMDQRRLAEFIQVIQQLLFPKSVDAKPCISFSAPFSLAMLETDSTQHRLMPAILDRVTAQLEEHLLVFEHHPHAPTSAQPSSKRFFDRCQVTSDQDRGIYPCQQLTTMLRLTIVKKPDKSHLN